MTPEDADVAAVPFPARRAIQQAIWTDCISPGGNEWTTWSDSVVLAECAAKALVKAGWSAVSLEERLPMSDAPITTDLARVSTYICPYTCAAGDHQKGAIRCYEAIANLTASGHVVVSRDALAELTKALDEAQLRSIEARNPGIDMDEVRRQRRERSRRRGLSREITDV